ncbi:ankyrin repeat-containing domain protein [Trichophaea hybrida]|nr:ankyrin repeat-containing domain protein [Trichophaea hybrida]
MVQGYEVVLQCDGGYLFSNEEDDNDDDGHDEFNRRMLHKRIISSMTRLASVYTATDEYEAAIEVYEKATAYISRSSNDFPANDFLASPLGDTVKDLITLYERQHGMLQAHLARHKVASSKPAIPLHRAIATGIPELVSAILDGDEVDINAEDFFGKKGLHRAANGGFPDVLEILLNRGADPNDTDNIFNKEWTAVMHACSSGSLRCVEILYDAGADIEAVSRYEDISAVAVAARFGHFEIVMMLQRAVGWKMDYMNYALQGAVRGGHYGLTRMLLDNDADPNTSDRRNRCTPLQIASDCGHGAIVRLLLQRNAKVDTVCFSGTALQISCKRGHIDIARMLLQCDADVNANLTSASQADREDLLDHGAHVNATSTPLQLACLEGHEGIVRLLLEYEADVNARGSYGPALHIVCERNLETIAKLLVEAGADVNLRHDIGGGVGGTALQSACRKGHEGIVKLLLGQQADMD